MKLIVVAGVGLVALAAASPAAARQTSPHEANSASGGPARKVAVEVGAVMGIIAQPYASAGIVVDGWSGRVSGIGRGDFGHGVQVNLGRVIRDEGNAKHTLGVVWAWFAGERWLELAYTFQAKGFFVEVGPGLGARNPFALGPTISHIYGQTGFVYRFGKKYQDD
jgi:hypothetical protein